MGWFREWIKIFNEILLWELLVKLIACSLTHFQEPERSKPPYKSSFENCHYWFVRIQDLTLFALSKCTSVWHLWVAFLRPLSRGESIAIDKLWGEEMSKNVHKKVELQLRGFNWFTSDWYCNGEFTSSQIALHGTATTSFIPHVTTSNQNRFFMIWNRFRESETIGDDCRR